jgi:hypothetical protein
MVSYRRPGTSDNAHRHHTIKGQFGKMAAAKAKAGGVE